MGRAGRHSKDMSDFRMKITTEAGTIEREFREFWPKSAVTPLATINRNCKVKHPILRLCGKHAALLQPASVFTSFDDSVSNGHYNILDCKVCRMYNNRLPKYQTHPSSHETSVYEALSALSQRNSISDRTYLAKDAWHTDCHVFDGKHGRVSSVDIYVPDCKLCIMVDGEQHFTKPRVRKPDSHTKKKVKRVEDRSPQLEVDKRFNLRALQEGMSVLRMHFEDAPAFANIVPKYLLKARITDELKGKIVFTNAFDKADLRKDPDYAGLIFD